MRGRLRRRQACRLFRPLANFWCEPTISWRWDFSRFNLKLVGSVGVSLAADGPSQMALSDVAFFRALSTVRTHEGQPLLYLLQPADAMRPTPLPWPWPHEGPCYLRTLRPDVPFLYNGATAFPLGGHHVLAEGHDLCIIAAGYMVHEARKALPLLKEQGIAATLVDLYSLPFDDVAILNCPGKSRPGTHGRR